MPVVREPTGHTAVGTFAGDRANAMLAGALRLGGMSVASTGGLALVVRDADASAVTAVIAGIDPITARPEVPPVRDGAEILRMPAVADRSGGGRHLSDRAALDQRCGARGG